MRCFHTVVATRDCYAYTDGRGVSNAVIETRLLRCQGIVLRLNGKDWSDRDSRDGRDSVARCVLEETKLPLG